MHWDSRDVGPPWASVAVVEAARDYRGVACWTVRPAGCRTCTVQTVHRPCPTHIHMHTYITWGTCHGVSYYNYSTKALDFQRRNDDKVDKYLHILIFNLEIVTYSDFQHRNTCIL